MPFTEYHCGGLNENGRCRLIYLNAWSLVGEILPEGLGVALLEMACHWVQTFELSEAYKYPNGSLCFQCAIKNVSPQRLL